MNWKLTAIAAATALSLVGLTAYAHGSFQPVHGFGGMMGGYSQGYGPGYGGGHMGPGTMGGYGGQGMGPGMMGGYGGYGMGPGMMGGAAGYGIGPGMMGGSAGYGMGPGMMGGAGLGGIDRLDLTDDQRSQLAKIEGDLRTKNWELMGKMHDQMDDLHDLDSASGKRDRSAILAANKRMTDLRQQMLENSLDATEKAEALLTPQQREQSKRYARSWRGYDRN